MSDDVETRKRELHHNTHHVEDGFRFKANSWGLHHYGLAL
jgi:hypothetical protein